MRGILAQDCHSTYKPVSPPSDGMASNDVQTLEAAAGRLESAPECEIEEARRKEASEKEMEILRPRPLASDHLLSA